MAENLKINPLWIPNRYSVINDKYKREIVMLVGRGCAWKQCLFCDYHLDFSDDIVLADQINEKTLSNVTGVHHALEVINSGSVFELSENTINLIKEIAIKKNIKTIFFESHYLYREKIKDLREYFGNINLEMKLGIESFDYNTREVLFKKGLGDHSPEHFRSYFDDCCLIIGIKGQRIEVVNSDIEIALSLFKRVCINIFTPNGTKAELDNKLVDWFMNAWYDRLKDNVNVDVLLDNSAFGVGGVTTVTKE